MKRMYALKDENGEIVRVGNMEELVRERKPGQPIIPVNVQECTTPAEWREHADALENVRR